MKILAIDTSCDDTSVAVTEGRRILSNVIFSQVQIHAPFGGVYPTVAKREHQTKINPAVEIALKRAQASMKDIGAFAVTYGPGLAPALEIGVLKAKELALTYRKPLIPVDHIEGHIYSSFAQNRNGNPQRETVFPLLAFVVSGGHTELVVMKDHISYEIIGQTLDDAAGEALDKAARMLNLGYPGGPIIEKLASEFHGSQPYVLPVPMLKHAGLDFSFSGLKTAFKRLVESLSEQERLNTLPALASVFQETVFSALLLKLRQVMEQYNPKSVVLGGGVTGNRALRKKVRGLVKTSVPLFFPKDTNLSSDNAAMIGIAAAFKYDKGIIIDPGKLDRIPRAHLDHYCA